MALAKYNSSLAYDHIIKRGIPGQVARVTDPDSDIPFDTVLDLDGAPIPALISNSLGYVQPFQIEDGPALVRLRVGNISYDLLDLTRVGVAAQAAQDAKQAAQDALQAAIEAGQSATVAVGSVVEGESANVQNVGTDHNAVFEFTLPRGPKGDQGDPGEPGAPGERGEDGTSVTITGSVASAAELPSSAELGEGFITQDDGHLHVWGGTSFTDVGVVRGPQGPQGLPGPEGEQGPAPSDGFVAELIQQPSTTRAVLESQFRGRVVRSASAPQTRGITYEWLGLPHASASVEKIDNVESRRNLATNPSFESGAGMGGSVLPAGGATVSQSTDWASSGTRSLKIVGGGSLDYSGGYPWGTIGPSVMTRMGVSPGKTYTLSVDFHQNEPQATSWPAGARCIWVGPTTQIPDAWAKSENAPNVAGTHRLQCTFTIPADATTMNAVFTLGSRNATGYFDNVCLVEGTEASYFDGDTEPSDTDILWVNTTTNKASTWDGGRWAALGPGREGTLNTFFGIDAGASNTGEGPTDPNVNGGYELTGFGVGAFMSAQRTWKSVAVGSFALRDSIDAYYNVAVGNSAMERTIGGIGMDAPNPNAPGSRNVAVGSNAMRYNEIGRGNVAIGRNASHSSRSSNYTTAVGTNANSGVVDGETDSAKTSSYIVAIGWGANFLSNADDQTAVGAHSLYQPDGGVDEGGNTAVGFYALSATGGGWNAALGWRAGIGLKAGKQNIAIGKEAIGRTTSGAGQNNIAIGTESLFDLTTGNDNIALGRASLQLIKGGSQNVSVGAESNDSTSVGRSQTVAVGFGTTTDGDLSNAIGYMAMVVTTNATALGAHANASGASGMALGHMSDSSATYAIALGREAVAGHTSAVALGNGTATTATNQINTGARHLEIKASAQPATPSSGNVRLWSDNGVLKSINSSGTVTTLAA